jgi:CRP-like cAMP-binding protein
MDIKHIPDIIKGHPFFEGMSEEHIETVAGCGSNAHFKAGEWIFRHGEEADRFFILREGRVAVEVAAADRGVLTNETLEKGDVFGFSWLFPPHLWNLDARALEPTRCISMDGRCLRGKCDDDPAFGYDIMKRFSSIIIQRLQATRLQLMDIYGPGMAAAKP